MQTILEKIKDKKNRGLVVLAVLLILFIILRCTPLLKYVNLCGTWYEEDSYGGWAFVLYSDGTCEIDNEYGTGEWAIVNGNRLKLTNSYGETQTAKIKSVTGSKLVLENGRGSEVTFYKGRS